MLSFGDASIEVGQDGRQRSQQSRSQGCSIGFRELTGLKFEFLQSRHGRKLVAAGT
jgi:hypothetical protein